MKTTVMQYTARGEGNELVTLVELEDGESHDEAFSKLKTWSDSKVSKKVGLTVDDPSVEELTAENENLEGLVLDRNKGNDTPVDLKMTPEDIKSFVDSMAEFKDIIKSKKKEEVPVTPEEVNDGVQG